MPQVGPAAEWQRVLPGVYFHFAGGALADLNSSGALLAGSGRIFSFDVYTEQMQDPLLVDPAATGASVPSLDDILTKVPGIILDMVVRVNVQVSIQLDAVVRDDSLGGVSAREWKILCKPTQLKTVRGYRIAAPAIDITITNETGSNSDSSWFAFMWCRTL